MTRAPLYVLLSAVAAAAAVLSFAALRDLALLCGFTRGLAWLLPVVVDAGAAAGTLVWLGGRDPEHALRVARRLALTLLGGSILANALSHGVGAYRAGAPWWVVIVACVVSGVAPAVVGAVVHLVALRGRPTSSPAALPPAPAERADPCDATPEPGEDRAAELIAEGVGRRKLARELQISEHAAKQLLRERRNGHRVEAPCD